MINWHRVKSGAFAFLLASLFSGGILLGGSEFVGFPWGPVAGVACWVLLGLIVNKVEG